MRLIKNKFHLSLEQEVIFFIWTVLGSYKENHREIPD